MAQGFNQIKWYWVGKLTQVLIIIDVQLFCCCIVFIAFNSSTCYMYFDDIHILEIEHLSRRTLAHAHMHMHIHAYLLHVIGLKHTKHHKISSYRARAKNLKYLNKHFQKLPFSFHLFSPCIQHRELKHVYTI